MPLNKNDSILIVGAGVFGLSTALELTRRGYTNITVLDRFAPPVPDGSSVDISRIIRIDYADPLYAKMAREAYSGWNAEYKDFFDASGYAILSEGPGHPYIEKSKQIIYQAGGRVDEFHDINTLKSIRPAVKANLAAAHGYHNPIGGWANAEGAIQCLATQCSAAGVSFITGPRGTVHSLRMSGDRVTGVNIIDGSHISASHVILSTGAWSTRLLNLAHAASASGQPVGFIQLTSEEAHALQKTPVIVNLTTGVFAFPPTPGSNILKLARHGFGFATAQKSQVTGSIVSGPKPTESNAATGYLPQDADQGLRDGLKQLFPALGDRPWLYRRMCWYTDTPKGDFIVDWHPGLKGLFVATGGAGHAFKFLPVLGRYVADCVEEKADASLREKWRLAMPEGKVTGEISMAGDGSRGGPPLRKLTVLEQAKL
ncbi:NAD(P)/FAD-dependent oxidoreductase [Aspergillus melleus]|uniref:NAD(P)/FAD-dependent oxidoreductase n=1 Tax=Aspergillus melleus TaxID=138277 RepID=UPI001E8D322D|nr:uncharacterized protein LDX57_012847 [Aspergillus melleus]KAH8435218.1 hypothetical protein LDX57_012847 [Aspergillus melleus]